jgi:LysR family hydrogen peroxide-inducible transcriptional activator
VADDELMAAMPADSPLAQASAASPEALERENLILLEDGHCLREHALSACRLAPPRLGVGEEPFEATSLPTLVQMVGSGLGVTFLPGMAVEAGLAQVPNVAVRPIAADHAAREIVVAWRSGSNRAAEGRLLAEVLKEA